jgi:hypothetical protein
MPKVAKRPQRDHTKATLSVDPNPTPDKEAMDFENEDERRVRRDREHELNLLKMHQGFIGRWTGSSNEAFNNGVILLLFLFVSLGGAEIGVYAGAALGVVADGLVKAIFAVIGYMFGSRDSGRSK